MKLTVELRRTDDGRWTAAVPALTGVSVYGASDRQAMRLVKAMALRTMANAADYTEFAIPNEIQFTRAK